MAERGKGRKSCPLLDGGGLSVCPATDGGKEEEEEELDLLEEEEDWGPGRGERQTNRD